MFIFKFALTARSINLCKSAEGKKGGGGQGDLVCTLFSTSQISNSLLSISKQTEKCLLSNVRTPLGEMEKDSPLDVKKREGIELEDIYKIVNVRACTQF